MSNNKEYIAKILDELNTNPNQNKKTTFFDEQTDKELRIMFQAVADMAQAHDESDVPKMIWTYLDILTEIYEIKIVPKKVPF